MYVYSAYARIEPTFNHYYNILRKEADANQAINWLNEISRKKYSHCSWVRLTWHTVLGSRDNKPHRGLAHWRFHGRLDERWCECGKFQKLNMSCSHVVVVACKHAYHEYRNYIHLVYTLGSVSNIYRGLFEQLHNEAYWRSCHEPIISPGPKNKRSTKGHFVSSCIHIEMDIRELSQPKRCFGVASKVIQRKIALTV